MNLLHMKYAVEVAKTGSINKAAEKLLIGQPNLSRAIKELEASFNIRIFERTPKGMNLTPDGRVFIHYATSILQQVDEVEGIFRPGAVLRERFSISVPRASYISDAFAKFSREIERVEKAEIFYKETNTAGTIQNILQRNYELGIVRYPENYESYYRTMLAEKELAGTLIKEFRYVLVMRADSPLAAKEKIEPDDLRGRIEIAHADPYVPALPVLDAQKEEEPPLSDRQIFVFERGAQFELLAQNRETYMWVSPIPQPLLARYGLTQRACREHPKRYRDVLVYRKGHRLSELEEAFIRCLMQSARPEADSASTQDHAEE